jgi:hypothetical protein
MSRELQVDHSTVEMRHLDAAQYAALRREERLAKHSVGGGKLWHYFSTATAGSVNFPMACNVLRGWSAGNCAKLGTDPELTPCQDSRTEARATQ